MWIRGSDRAKKCHVINVAAYISVKLNDCSGIWFTKCISISVFIIGNHFVTHQTNAQNRIRIISVILRIFSKVKNLLTFKKYVQGQIGHMSGFFQYPRIETERDWLTAGVLRQYWNSSPEIRHFGSYLFSTDFKIEKSKYRHRKRRRNDSLYKLSFAIK